MRKYIACDYFEKKDVGQNSKVYYFWYIFYLSFGGFSGMTRMKWDNVNNCQ
jgi:hypothetical protein